MDVFGSPIVVGYIHTPAGDAALERAIAEAENHDALLVVVHSEPTVGEVEILDGVEADDSMDRVTGILSDRDVRFQARHVDGKDPADDLVRVADEVDAGLIVIGLRRRSPVGKLIMGCNAQQILLKANCPVLAVKAP